MTAGTDFSGTARKADALVSERRAEVLGCSSLSWCQLHGGRDAVVVGGREVPPDVISAQKVRAA